MVAWLTVKAVAIFLGLATTAFCVSTIVLAVQNADLENDLQDALDKIDALTADTTSTSTSTTTTSPETPDPGSTSPTTPGGGGEGTTPDPGSSSTASSGTTPGGDTTSDGGSSSSTTTSVAPIYPELPTGLPDPDEIEWRLPSDLKPIKYKLYYQPNLQTGACEGTVSIQFQLNNVTNLIVLHAKDLNVHSISILNMMARMRIAIEEWYLDDTRELLMIKLREVLSLNKAYTLSASFDCDLSSLTGSYMSSYTGSEGIVK